MLSIIVPTLNEERALRSTLLGLQSLKGVPFELIVSDSGSTDGTMAIVSALGVRTVSYDGEPRNAARGRNVGAALASGEFFVFVDADVSVPQIDAFFTKALKAFEDDHTLVGLAPRIGVLPEVATWADKASYVVVNEIIYLSNSLLRVGAASGELQMVKASAFKQINGYSEDLYIGEDNDLFRRLAKIGKTRQCRDLLVLHPCRRPHKIGWGRLWWEWIVNLFYVLIVHKPWHGEWPHVR